MRLGGGSGGVADTGSEGERFGEALAPAMLPSAKKLTRATNRKLRALRIESSLHEATPILPRALVEGSTKNPISSDGQDCSHD
jgi:hypothetical protein